MIKIKTPAKLCPFPPVGWFQKVKVSDTDSWGALATRFGREDGPGQLVPRDPWDIIFFNFQTRVPEEVNYYMAKHIGCTKSKDTKNYSFSSQDRPGIIYIPPAFWTPSDGTMKLHDPEARHITKFLSSPILHQVLGANQERIVRTFMEKIAVLEDRDLPVLAEYDFKNTLYVSFTGLTDAERCAWVVKEAYHIGDGPYGWGATQISVDGEANSWVALAGYLDLRGISDTRLYPHLNRKKDLFHIARLEWTGRGHLPAKDRSALKLMVVRDSDFLRRLGKQASAAP
jgi:hypothetical protein